MIFLEEYRIDYNQFCVGMIKMSNRCFLAFLIFIKLVATVSAAVVQKDFSWKIFADQGNLPAKCYNPSGDTCDWYSQCFEKRFPCQHTSHSYAIDFAEHYCEKYGKMYNKFSSDGKKWIDAVRKCLQVKLVPLMKSSKAITCEEIKTYGFKTHVPCYQTPDPSQAQISFCNLPFRDWLRAAYTIKTSFIKVPVESVKGAIGTLTACIKRGK